jgi:serine/threonine protein kinase
LKTWRRSAPPDFLDRFHRLQADLALWGAEDIDRPIAVRIDKHHRPSVLSEFRRGVGILDRVRFGTLDSKEAIDRLDPLIALVKQGHVRNLTHGSIVPGNVIIDARSGRARLLDFGLTPLLVPQLESQTFAANDLDGFAALTQALNSCRSGSFTTSASRGPDL